MKPNFYFSDDYDDEGDPSPYDHSEPTDDYQSIDLNDISPMTKSRDNSPHRNSYQKIVLKEFPTTTMTTTTAEETFEKSDEMSDEMSSWMKGGLKPPTPPFSTIWPETHNNGKNIFEHFGC